MNKFSLDTHPKIKSGFTTPPDYFEELPRQILEKIRESPDSETKIFSLHRIIYAAAAILVLALSLPFFMQNSTNSLEQIDTKTLENYLSYQSNVSQYDLINLIDVSDLNAIHYDLAVENQEIEELLISNPNFENYIIE